MKTGLKEEIEKLYGQPWPYDLRAGIGLKMTAIRLKLNLFIDETTGAGCPIDIAQQIMTELRLVGIAKTTVSPYIDLMSAIKGMANAGVETEIIPPHQNYIDLVLVG